MKLLIDICNTRLKWAFADREDVPEAAAVLHEGEPARILAQLPAHPVDSVWIAQVTGAQHEAALDAAVRLRYGCSTHYARSTARWRELQSGYAEPERLGVDRWLVMIAAWARYRSAFCVVDAGTALTADAVDDRGQHLGGFIAAGLQTQQHATLGATRFATRDSVPRYDAGLGRDTEACVRQGAMLACLGAIDRAGGQAGAQAVRLMTGGDARLLLPYLSAGWQHRPNLVLEGLLALAADRSSAVTDR